MDDVFGQEIVINDYVFIVDKYKEIDVGRVIGFTNTMVKVCLKGGRGVVNINPKKVGLKKTLVNKSNTKE